MIKSWPEFIYSTAINKSLFFVWTCCSCLTGKEKTFRIENDLLLKHWLLFLRLFLCNSRWVLLLILFVFWLWQNRLLNKLFWTWSLTLLKHLTSQTVRAIRNCAIYAFALIFHSKYRRKLKESHYRVSILSAADGNVSIKESRAKSVTNKVKRKFLRKTKTLGRFVHSHRWCGL